MATNKISQQAGTARPGTLSTTAKVGWVISGLLIAFLLVDGITKLVKLDASVEGTVDLGYPEGQVAWIGLALVTCTILFAIPRTAVFGAILLTGYLGGAIATQVRIEEPAFLLPAVLGVLAWIGLALRDVQTRAIFR